MAVWKDVEGYEGIYQVSNTGFIKSLGNNATRKEKLLKTYLREGYPCIELRKEGKRKKHSIHRLVAKAFVENPFELEWVNHKDEDKQNACSYNLEWITPLGNCNYSRLGKQMALF